MIGDASTVVGWGLDLVGCGSVTLGLTSDLTAFVSFGASFLLIRPESHAARYLRG